MDGGVAALESLVESRLRRTFRIAVAILGSEAQAGEVVQDAWLAARTEIRPSDDPARFQAIVDRTLVSLCGHADRPADRPGPDGPTIEELAVRPRGSGRAGQARQSELAHGS
jgi:DNA-directed RNA polymerase specialized sigma24 family protein